MNHLLVQRGSLLRHCQPSVTKPLGCLAQLPAEWYAGNVFNMVALDTHADAFPIHRSHRSSDVTDLATGCWRSASGWRHSVAAFCAATCRICKACAA